MTLSDMTTPLLEVLKRPINEIVALVMLSCLVYGVVKVYPESQQQTRDAVKQMNETNNAARKEDATRTAEALREATDNFGAMHKQTIDTFKEITEEKNAMLREVMRMPEFSRSTGTGKTQ